MTDRQDDDLVARLRDLPTEIAPRRDLLPEIEARIAASGRDRRSGGIFVRRGIAAALIFGAGILVGRLGRRSDEVSTVATLTPTASDFAAATEVQRIGTAYVLALSRVSRQVADASMRRQAQESATATLATVVRQIAILSGRSPAPSPSSF